MTCSQAYTTIRAAIVSETTAIGDVSVDSTTNSSPYNYINRIFGNRFQSTIEVSSALDNLAESMFPGYQSTSEALFQQAFVMNGLQSNLAQENPQLLAAISQAEVAQTTGIAAASAVYIKKLPRLRAMMKLIIVSLAPIISACFLAQAGRPALQWMVALLWVSLWLPMMGIIKATYIASAIDELHVVVNSSGGLTMPNQLRIMSWLSDTSTVAGTLAFMIPALSGIALQMVAPRLAAGIVSGFVAGARVSDGFAQRAGMSALSGAERTAKELENDKINQTFMEAGDVQAMRLSQMNQLIRNHTGVGMANFYRSDPTGAGGSHTASMVGMGTSISQSSMKAKLNALSQLRANSEAIAAVAATSMANDAIKSGSTSQIEAASEAVQNSLTDSETQKFSDASSATQGIVEQATKGSSLTSSQKQAITNQLMVEASAGFEAFGTGVTTSGKGSSNGLEEQVGAGTAAKIRQAMADSKEVKTFMEERGQTLSKARSNMESNGVSASDVESKSFSDKQSIADSATSTATFMESILSSVSSTNTAGGNFSFNLGTASAYLQQDHLEDMAGLAGMSNLRGALDANPHEDIDVLRRAAYADLSVMANSALAGDNTSLANFTGALNAMSGFSNYSMHDAAGQSANIMKANALMGDALGAAGDIGLNRGDTLQTINNARNSVNAGQVHSATTGRSLQGGPIQKDHSTEGQKKVQQHFKEGQETVTTVATEDRKNVYDDSIVKYDQGTYMNIENKEMELLNKIRGK